jgi:hypothetical protein
VSFQNSANFTLLIFDSIGTSPEGWSDQELGFLWMQKTFDPETKDRCDGAVPRLLIIDGHNSHTSYKFLDYAYSNDIIVLCLPPHTTHALQPCDVGVFGPLAKAWSKEVQECFNNGIIINKFNLIEVYARARRASFKVATIQMAFQKTGIWPPNYEATLKSDNELWKATTTESVLPIPSTFEELPTVNAKLPTTDIQPDSASSPPITSTPADSIPVDPSLGMEITPSLPSAPAPSRRTSSPPTHPSSDAQLQAVESTLEEHLSVQSLSNPASIEPSPCDYKIPEVAKTGGIPALPPPSATRLELWDALVERDEIVNQLASHISANAAWAKLFTKENERIRNLLYGRINRPKNVHLNTKARVLTNPEGLASSKATEEAKERKDREKAARAEETKRKKEERERAKKMQKENVVGKKRKPTTRRKRWSDFTCDTVSDTESQSSFSLDIVTLVEREPLASKQINVTQEFRVEPTPMHEQPHTLPTRSRPVRRCRQTTKPLPSSKAVNSSIISPIPPTSSEGHEEHLEQRETEKLVSTVTSVTPPKRSRGKPRFRKPISNPSEVNEDDDNFFILNPALKTRPN